MINADRILEDFLKLAAIDSPTLGERTMADELISRLRELGCRVTEDDVGKKLGGTAGNLLAVIDGTIPGESLLFAAHMDTVEPCENKKPVVKDGRISSSGDTILGSDDISGIVEILEALKSIKENNRPHRSLELLFTVSEEYFLKGAESFDYTKCKARQGYILDVDGAIGTAVVGAPTGIRFIAHVHGKAAHAAIAPEEGINAVAIASKAIASMKLGRLDSGTTASIGIIKGGLQGNIVPDYCFVEGETRSLSNAAAEAQQKHMEDCFIKAAAEMGGSADFEITRVYDAYRVEESSQVVKRFEKACNDCGVTPRLICSTGGSDNSMLSAKGLEGIVLASGMHEIHSVNEYTTVDELVKMAEIVEKLMTSEM